MNRRSFSTVPVCLAALLAGCAATPSVREERRAGEGLARDANVEVVVQVTESVRKVPEHEQTAAELGKEFAEALRAAGKSQPNAPRQLEARLTIETLSYVHAAGRFLVGVLAGRAMLKVTMVVRDKASGAVLGTFVAEHVSSQGQGIFAPTTSRQVEAIARELAAKL